MCKSQKAVECITDTVVSTWFLNLRKSCLILEWKTSVSGVKKVHKEDTKYLAEEDIWKFDDN